ncbi:MAG: hypothetical protein ACC645_02010 [Pirellulales bacterium]
MLAVALVGMMVAASGCGSDGGSSASKPRRNVQGFAGIDIPPAEPEQPAPATPSAPAPPPAAATPPAEQDEEGERDEQPSTNAHNASADSGDQNGTVNLAADTGAEVPAEEEEEEEKEGTAGGVSRRPRDVNQWKLPDDFYSAAVANDSQLAQAIEAVSKRQRNKVEAARTWIFLMMPRPKTKATASKPEGKVTGEETAEKVEPTGATEEGQEHANMVLPRPNSQIAVKLIAALARNRTSLGRKAVKKLLTGKVPLPIGRRELLTASIGGLAEQLDPASEKILLVLATKPQRFVEMPLVTLRDVGTDGGAAKRAAGVLPEAASAPPLPDWLVNEVLRAVRQRASTDFRTRLAEFLTDPKVPMEIASPIEGFLVVDDPKNLRAQVILYLNDSTSDSVQTRMAERLSKLSGEAVGRLQELGSTGSRPVADDRAGGPSAGDASEHRSKRPRLNPARPTSRSGTPNGRVPDETPLLLAQQLWKPETVQVMQARITATKALEGHSKSLYLMGTIPLEPARRAMSALLSKHQEDGAQLWSSAGLLGREPADPALLVLVKIASQEDGKKTRRRPRRSRRSGRERGGGQESFGDPWGTETDRFVTQLCERFHAVANGAVELSDEEKKSLPIRLHRGARITARLHLRWPEQVPGKLAELGIGPLELHYIRTEGEQKIRLIRSHYGRNVRGGNKHEKGDVLWYDGIRRMANKGTARSVDVRISGVSQNGRQDEEVPLVVEILTIEIPDPAAETESPSEGS